MKLSEETKQFIREHMTADLNRLLLSASRYPEVDVPFAVEQIASRRQIREKLPAWYANPDLIFPARITTEQCSSEVTALYKQQLVQDTDHLCDLTGGLGIDSGYFSRKVNRVTYIERFETYCQAAQHNFRVLGWDNITVCQGDSGQLIDGIDKVDVFYLDPARRGEGNKRIFALQECEPDLTQLLPTLFEKAPKVIAKLSPMADIREVCRLLPHTTAIHVLSVKNECKELLYVLERDKTVSSPSLHCINITTGGDVQAYTFTPEQELNIPLQLASAPDTFLYEPNSSVLKAGAFKSISAAYQVNKLHPSSHLYTSEQLVPDFPGRVFRITGIFSFNNKLLKGLAREIPQANLTVRNFPVSVEELRKRSKIREGGDIYLFATTLHNGGKVIIKAGKA
ncbi:MAG: class I SAM-dependent methyltransferase [Tannerellaceae bacterium]|nr:class I SAM-dependent methyltransferase [Tannerellaceae bacterium]